MFPQLEQVMTELAQDLAERYARLQERIDNACRAAGRRREEICLLAVSKFHPAGDIARVASLGQVDFGENYVQEAMEKRAQLANDPDCARIRWHMTGHVQSRKASLVAGAFALVHTVDSLKLAAALERRLAGSGQEGEMSQEILIEVNIAAEAQKSGVAADALPELADYIVASCPHLSLQGLMCLPPVFDAGDAARPSFAALRRHCEFLRTRLGLPMPQLSMGMSGDFAAAIAEGATIVRIGTDIFGPRPARPVLA